MCTDTPQADDRVQAYRRLTDAARIGAQSGKDALDRYGRALLLRAQAAREVSSKGLRHMERLCDLNEAGLLDYRGRGPEGARYSLSNAGAGVLAAAGMRAS